MIKVYATGHQISNVVCAAFAEGFDGQLVPANKLLDGPAAMYGFLRGTEHILQQCMLVGRPFWYIDHGYFKSGHYEGYYRITRNSMQARPRSEKFPDDRWRSLSLDIRPWKRTGKHILIAPMSNNFASLQCLGPKGIDPQEGAKYGESWLSSVINEITNYTDRPVKIKYKEQGKLEEELKDCWCLVTHSSNAAIDALLAGVPVVTLGESAANPVSWKLENIEKPEWPAREPLMHALAYQQFTLDEMRDGTAKELLYG